MPLENWEIDGFKNYPYISHKLILCTSESCTYKSWPLKAKSIDCKWKKTKQKQMNIKKSRYWVK